MAEFRLPPNSRINRDGKVHEAPAGATNVRAFKVYRYDPDGGANPRVDTYKVDMDDCPRRPHQDQERVGPLALLPSLLP